MQIKSDKLVISGNVSELKALRDTLTVAIATGASEVLMDAGTEFQKIVGIRNLDPQFTYVDALLNEPSHFEIIGGYTGEVIGCCSEDGILDEMKSEPTSSFRRVRQADCRCCKKDL